MSGALLPVYAQFPLRAVSGQGSWITDDKGEKWLDAYGGHAVASTGHCHPEVVRAIAEQAATLIFYSTVLPHSGREQLAELIAENCPDPLKKVFFCNSGAEANENALGLARKVTGRQKIVSVSGGWHGRTVATLAVTDGAKYEDGARRAGMPLSFKVPFNDVAAIGAAVDDTVAAVIVEPVQGLTGARDCSTDFLRAARLACDREGAVLIFDEIQCGVGRTGTYFAYQLVDPPVMPDIMTAAKPLACGLPFGIIAAHERAAKAIRPGMHGSTFGGNALSARVALEFFDILPELLPAITRVGDYFRFQLRRLATRYSYIREVRGFGLMVGVELAMPGKDIVDNARRAGLLLNCTHDTVLRFLPPYIITEEHVDEAIGILSQVLPAA